MEFLESSKVKSYSVIFSKSLNGSTIISEKFEYDGLTINLTLGELLFTVMESQEVLQQLMTENGDRNDTSAIDEYFSDKEYNLRDFLMSFNIDKTELKEINEVNRYLNEIVENRINYNYDTLRNLFYSIFPNGHAFRYLLNNIERYRVRHILSKLPIPFGCSTENICETLNNTYAAFSFFTITDCKTLSELCALSLFEVLESGQFVRKCNDCNRFFVSSTRTAQLCNRATPVNKHRSCEQIKSKNYNKNYRKSNSVKEYKKIYMRLFKRANSSNTSLTDKKNFEDFKKGWALLKVKKYDTTDFEEQKMNFLQLDRWK